MAVGYATLYGDMAGGFAVLKDISKTLVYRLARYRNSLGRVIPERIITRPPSAELRAGPDRPGLAAAVRRARRDPRGLRRARPEPGRDRRAGLSRRTHVRRSCGSSRSASTSGARRRSASASRRAASARTGAIRSRRRGTSGRTSPRRGDASWQRVRDSCMLDVARTAAESRP